MNPESRGMPLLAWSRVWSPLVDDSERVAAWDSLGLPRSFDEIATDYWSTFHTGMPLPAVPLVLHAAISRDGAALREELMLVIRHLGLVWSENVLPADHLAAVCEVLAVAVDRGEDVIVREISARYLKPWCTIASQVLDERADGLRALPPAFMRAVQDATVVS